MPYTVWSRGRLIGESELAYRQAFPKLRVGDFQPSELGETLMPVMLGEGPALNALYEASIRLNEEGEAVDRAKDTGDWPAAVKRTTEFADAMSIHDEVESLALELHDSTGAVVATESIWFQDTHRLVALAREELAQVYPDMDFEDDDPEPWEPAPPRYQIYVALEGHDGRMKRGRSPNDLIEN